MLVLGVQHSDGVVKETDPAGSRFRAPSFNTFFLREEEKIVYSRGVCNL